MKLLFPRSGLRGSGLASKKGRRKGSRLLWCSREHGGRTEGSQRSYKFRKHNVPSGVLIQVQPPENTGIQVAWQLKTPFI